MGSVAAAFAEHVGVGEGGGAAEHVDGAAAGEVEAAEAGGPAGWVPDPAGYGVLVVRWGQSGGWRGGCRRGFGRGGLIGSYIDDCGPYEHEDNAGKYSTAFCDGSDGDGHAMSEGIEFQSPRGWKYTYVRIANMT